MTKISVKQTTWKWAVGVLGAVAIMIGIVLVWIPALIEDHLNQQDFNAIFNKATGGSFSSNKLALKLLPTPHVIIPEGRIGIPGRLSGTWRTAHVYPAFTSLLKGKLQVDGIILEQPDFTFSAPPSPTESPTRVKPNDIKAALRRHLQAGMSHMAATLPKGTIEIHNGSIRANGLLSEPLHLDQIDLSIEFPPDRFNIELHCHSNLWSTLHISGFLEAGPLSGKIRCALSQFDPMAFGKNFPAIGIQWTSRPWDIDASINLNNPDHATSTLRVHIPDLMAQRNAQPVQLKELHLETSIDYSPAGFRIDRVKMLADQPQLAIDGNAVIDLKTPHYQIDLTGHRLTIDPLREAALALAGDDETVAGIFDVLRGGKVPWITFRTRGQSAEELAVFHNMTISGVVENGRLFIPGAELDLTQVHGRADISEGILKGSRLEAAYGQTTGKNGQLWLDLDQENEVPFSLGIEVAADLAPLPALLAKWVDDPVFKGEMKRIHPVTGTARGMLILDGRNPTLDVTVDVTSCRFDAEYDRLPASLSINEGLVQYTPDRIRVIGMKGTLDATSFANLTGQVAFGDTAILQIDSAGAQIATHQILPWLRSYGVFDDLPFGLASENGMLALTQLKLEGPLLAPKQWAFAAGGTAHQLDILSPDLPGPAKIEMARFRASTTKFEFTEARVRIADADLAFTDAQILLKNNRPTSAAITIDGTIGPVSEKWASNAIDLGKRLRMKTPVTISSSTITWAADSGEKTFLGQMTSGGGTSITLDLKLEGDDLRYQNTSLEDQDSKAELEVIFGPEHLEISFDGNVTSATLKRLMQDSHYATGSLEGRFKAHIYPDHPGRSSASGQLRARNIHQPLRIAETLHIDELHLEARDNKVFLEPAVIQVDHQTHKVTGSVGIENDDFVLDLVHSATGLALSPPDTPTTGTATGDANDLDLWGLPLRGRIISRLDHFKLGELQWAPFDAAIRIDAGHWHCRIEEAAICGVETRGNIWITPDSMTIALAPETADADLDNTMTCLLEKPDLIDGRFDLTGRLSTKGPPDKLSQSIQGAMQLNAREGRIYRFNLLSKTLAVVNVTEIFRGKLPDLMQDGLAYDSIDVQVSITDSVVTIDQAVIDGASANIAAQGTVDLVTGETDMIVLVAPFKTMDALVQYTPVIRDWLGGTLISIPVRVTGAFSDPTVTPLSPTAVGSSLMNLMKKTINLPVKIVEPLWKKKD